MGRPGTGDQDDIGRVLLRTGAAVVVAHAFSAVDLFLYLEFVAPTEETNRHMSRTFDVVLALTFIAAALVLGGRDGWKVCEDRLRPWKEGRTPSPDERARALALPARLGWGAWRPWAVAAVGFGIAPLCFGHTAAMGLRVTGTTLVAGMLACAMSYLLAERSFRPVAVSILDGAVPTAATTSMGVRRRLFVSWIVASGVPLLALLTLPAYAAGQRNDLTVAVTVLAAAGLVLGLVTTGLNAAALAEPLDRVRGALAAVEHGDYTVRVPVDDGGEMGLVEAGVNRMVAGLEERERLRDLFGRHVGPDVARLALEQGSGMRAEQREATALFVDIVGSTAMAEVLPAGEVLATLNAFFAAVVQCVNDQGGWVNKFEGDGALCVFGAPATQRDHAARALRAARAIDAALRRLAAEHPGLTAGIGVSSGPVVAGNVGTEARYEYTVVGGPVNEAARLTDIAKGREGRVLASGATVAAAGPDEAAEWSDCGSIALRGRSRPTDVFELREAAEIRQA